MEKERARNRYYRQKRFLKNPDKVRAQEKAGRDRMKERLIREGKYEEYVSERNRRIREKYHSMTEEERKIMYIKKYKRRVERRNDRDRTRPNL